MKARVLAYLALAACATNPRSASFDQNPSTGDASSDSGATGDDGSAQGDAGTPPLFGGDGGSDACVPTSPTETTCDGKDDDCNGKIDDVDVGKDGICDCVRIGLLGKPGYYGSNNFQQWLVSKGTKVTRVQQTTTEALDAAALAPFDMVILDWLQRTYTTTEVKAFSDWLVAGHGALALSGFAELYEVERPNSLMTVLGMTFTGANQVANRQTVTDFSPPHALSSGVTSVTFYGGSAVIGGAPVVPGTHAAFARVGASVVGMAHEGPTARAVAWGDEWIEFDSEWSSVPDINRFWANIVSFLTPRCEVPPPPR